MPYGYAGKLLFADLSTGALTVETPDEGFYRSCIGGTGMGAKVMMERTKAGLDPLGPDNMLCFASGPFTGTGVYGGGRFMVTTKSPLTMGWVDSNSGGTWGPSLKNAGFDGLFFTGISETPVVLVIDQGRPRLMDASGLWGKDTYETEDSLQEMLGDPGSWTVSCVGPAGEQCSLLAGIVNEKGRIAARSGVGAVMGSKRLKAIAVRGPKGGRVAVADPDGLRAVQKEYLAAIKASGFMGGLTAAGTGGGLSFLLSIGDCPTDNWISTGTEAMPSANKLDAGNMDVYKLKSYGCHSCPVRCGAIVKVEEGPYASQDETHRPEYETLAAMGTLCHSDGQEPIIRANEICNRHGIDTISVGGTIAFAIECYENGLITRDDTDGLELTWGNAASMVALTELIAKREGFGAVLADGCKRAAERIGKGSEEYAMQVGGREMPMHDPRATPAMGLHYIADATPAQHCGSQSPAMLDAGSPLGPDPLLQTTSAGPFGDYDSKGEHYARGASYYHLLSAAGLCSLYCQMDTPPVVELLRPITGWDMDWAEGLETGRRILTLRQAFNFREGIRPADVKLPKRFAVPLGAGPMAGHDIPFEVMRADYYRALGWDPETGRPLPATLDELGVQIELQA